MTGSELDAGGGGSIPPNYTPLGNEGNPGAPIGTSKGTTGPVAPSTPLGGEHDASVADAPSGHLKSTVGNELPSVVTPVDGKTSDGTVNKVQEKFSESLPTLKENERYLDPNKLLKAKERPAPEFQRGTRYEYSDNHREFTLHEAMHLTALTKATDKTVRRRLQKGSIDGFAKAAKVGTEEAEKLGIQTSPFAHKDDEYHRSSPGSRVVMKAHYAFADAMGLDPNDQDFRLVNNPLVTEVFERHFPHPDLDLNIDSMEKFDSLVDKLLADAKEGKYPEHTVLINCSQLFPPGTDPKQIKELSLDLQDRFLSKLDEFLKNNPDVKLEDVQEGLMKHMNIMAMTEFKGQHVMLLPSFLEGPRMTRIEPQGGKSSLKADERQEELLSGFRSRRKQCMANLRGLMTNTGFRITPNQARRAWLDCEGLEGVLEDSDLFMPELATKGTEIPTVAASCTEFVNSKNVDAFRKLSADENAPPYLKVLPEATAKLLDGLAAYNPAEGGIDKVYEDAGIKDMLQVSYFRMQNAMGEAVMRGKAGDQIGFSNSIEVIHNEIRTILSIVRPHDKGALEKSVLARLSDGTPPVLPAGLNAKVHLKASAMHGIASAIAGVEKEKGTNKLNVVALKDSYYETAGSKEYGMLDKSTSHQLAVLDGDAFNENGIDGAFDGNNPPKTPIDLFVCEFHHNISVTRQDYKPEDLAGQVKAMAKKGMLADKCTIIMDTTINTEKADDIAKFLADPEINKMIKEGKLNVVMVRSAQKFDMLGMDNYYGGVTVSVNNPEKFQAFNARMDHRQDQLGGINYQGLAHLHANAADMVDEYRKGVMSNTQKLYSKLPEKAIFKPGSKNMMQVSQINDDKVVFLDIKFPGCPKAAEAFETRMKAFALEQGMAYTTRASFGFSNTNFTSIGAEKKRLNVGLEGEDTMTRYAEFFAAVQDQIDKVTNPKLDSRFKNLKLDGASVFKKRTPEQLDTLLEARIRNMTI